MAADSFAHSSAMTLPDADAAAAVADHSSPRASSMQKDLVVADLQLEVVAYLAPVA